MKRFFLLAITGLLAISSCKNDQEFSVNGKIENAGSIKQVQLYEMDQLIDSAFLNENNEFKFRRISEDPNFYTMVVGEKNFLIIAQNGDEIDFETNFTDTTNTYKIDGSSDSEKIRDFNQVSNESGKVYQNIQKEYTQKVSENPAAKDSIFKALLPVFQKNMNSYSEKALKFGEENKDNLAGFYAVGTVDQSRYETQLIKYAEEIKNKFPKNKAVQSFADRMLALKVVSIGQPAPLFELPTPDNKIIKLTDFKGKYVLVDFWASWCAPCRDENPNLVKQYNTFKNKGFTVLGVSLDKSKTAWEKAIADDNLAWTQVSELKEWDGKVAMSYRVEAIPASFILDPQGKIIAKNLRGAELEAFLNKTLNN